MGRFADLLGTVASSFGIGAKGSRATLDTSGLSADRALALPDASGTVLLNGKLPFVKADGTNSPIPINASNALPFTLADGTVTSIPMST